MMDSKKTNNCSNCLRLQQENTRLKALLTAQRGKGVKSAVGFCLSLWYQPPIMSRPLCLEFQGVDSYVREMSHRFHLLMEDPDDKNTGLTPPVKNGVPSVIVTANPIGDLLTLMPHER